MRSMILEKGEAFTSADFRTALRTAASVPFHPLGFSDEDELKKWFSTNYNVEVHAYVKNGKYCVVNNTYEPQSTTVYKGDGTSFDLDLEANGIYWYEI